MAPSPDPKSTASSNPIPQTSPSSWGDAFTRLTDLMTFLRSEDGCDWDRAQTLDSLRPYLLEEAHEVLDALDRKMGPDVHCKELGDLLLQVVFQAQIQREHQAFDAGDVCIAITEKLIRRHPELFDPNHSGEKLSWEAIKAQERERDSEAPEGLFDSVPHALPALLRAYRMGEKANEVGFDWPDTVGVIEKIEEELGELKEAVARGNEAETREEIGDLLYATVNLSRHLKIDPESALRGTMTKFKDRFDLVEQQLWREGKRPQELTLEDLEERWQRAKMQLKTNVTDA